MGGGEQLLFTVFSQGRELRLPEKGFVAITYVETNTSLALRESAEMGTQPPFAGQFRQLWDQ